LGINWLSHSRDDTFGVYAQVCFCCTAWLVLGCRRCSQDVVEVPSHLWEHFATDSRSLALLARHADTRQPLPPQLAQQLAGLSSVTPALELQQQVRRQQSWKNACRGCAAS
jgi:intermediate peptidase